MIIDQKDINISVNNYISANMKQQQKNMIELIIEGYKSYITYNKNHKKRYLTRKVFSENNNKIKINTKNYIDLNQYNQIKYDKNINKIYNQLYNNKVLTKELFNYISFYCELNNENINDVIKRIREHDQNIIKMILISNKYFIIEKQEEKQIIKQENNKIQNKEKKQINCREIFIKVMRKSRIEINQHEIIIIYNKFLRDLQDFINNNEINYMNIFKKIILLNNHQKKKLYDNQIKMLAEEISNE